MAYSTNPQLPKVRRDTVRMLRKGNSMRAVARYFGFAPSTVYKWSQKAYRIGDHPIPTQSSRPKTHSARISSSVRTKVILKRTELKRTIEVIHYALKQEQVNISCSSMYRILRDAHMLKRKSPWKRLFRQINRPEVKTLGDLVQMDTMHFMVSEKRRIYVYALIDLYGRIGYAKAVFNISSKRNVEFLREAKKKFPFVVKCIQTDHGPEFGKYFSQKIDIVHRHSRIRKPNDNAYIERFNRTLQEECLNHVVKDVYQTNKVLNKYLYHYNNTRYHLGLNFKTPNDMILTT